MYYQQPPLGIPVVLSRNDSKSVPADPSSSPPLFYPETPEPSSPDIKVHMKSFSLSAADDFVVAASKGKDQQASLDTRIRTVDHGVNMSVRMKPQRKILGETTSDRQRGFKKTDPLGNSLHSYISGRHQTTDKYDLSEKNHNWIIEEEESPIRRRSIRSRPSVLRSKRASSMPSIEGNGLYSSIKRPDLIIPRSNSIPGRIPTSGRRTIPCDFPSDDYCCGSCARRIKNTCYEHSIQSQPMGWVLFLFITSVLCSGLYFANEHFRLQYVHKQLLLQHEEKSQLLMAAHKQVTYFSQIHDKSDWSSKIMNGFMNSLLNTPEETYETGTKDYDKNNDSHKLHSQVQVLQETIQEMAMDQLKVAFPQPTSSESSTIETQVVLEGYASPLSFAISYQDVPYTAWTWLDQVQKGVWHHAQLTHVGNDDFIEIRAGEWENTAPTIVKRLKFKEEGVVAMNGDQRFVLGLRNSVGTTDSRRGLILTIHLSQGTCGQVDQDEICFGKVVGGFDSLRMLRSQKQTVTVESIMVR